MVSSSMGKIAQVEPNSGDMLAMVARSARGRPFRPSPKNSHEFVHDALLAQHLGDRQYEVGGRGSGGRLPMSLNPMTWGMSHGHGVAEHGRLGFDAAHAPAEHAQSVDHGGVRIGADQGVGVGEFAARGFVRENDAGQAFDIDLVDYAGVGRHDFEVAERRLAPSQEHVALAVAAELDFIVMLQRVGRAVLRRPARSDR